MSNREHNQLIPIDSLPTPSLEELDHRQALIRSLALQTARLTAAADATRHNLMVMNGSDPTQRTLQSVTLLNDDIGMRLGLYRVGFCPSGGNWSYTNYLEANDPRSVRMMHSAGQVEFVKTRYGEEQPDDSISSNQAISRAEWGLLYTTSTDTVLSQLPLVHDPDSRNIFTLPKADYTSRLQVAAQHMGKTMQVLSGVVSGETRQEFLQIE